MKNKFIFTRYKKLFYALTIVTITFSACKKVPATPSSSTSSGLMIFNLIPENSLSVAFAFSNVSLTNTPLPFPNYSGSYLSIPSGTEQLGLYKANSDSLLQATNFVFESSKYYTAFALGANGNYINMITDDHLDSLPTNTGNAFVRYINAIPDSSKPMVTISSNGNNIVNAATPFTTVSNFIGIAPGNISVNMNNGSDISSSRTISLGANDVYTILLTGIPNTTDTTTAVQIRYIQNGSINP
ncbi:MAG TPA: DUF4397 domain-containing protein [Hanamia sp.]|nr:DUF4397 domain-containing protein [Hanamia sp.]